jgi:hypothetical protein
MGGGTEAFPDLGKHCQFSDCHQLDFLPFSCQACHKVFCVEHRSCKSHECPKPDYNSRKVIVCKTCSISIEITGRDGEDKNSILEKHEKSGDCDPRKKKKPTCPVRRCKEILSFSNTCNCKTCGVKVCLKHRFPADHDCKHPNSSSSSSSADNGFLIALASRLGLGYDCGNTGRNSNSKRNATNSRSVKAH